MLHTVLAIYSLHSKCQSLIGQYLYVTLVHICALTSDVLCDCVLHARMHLSPSIVVMVLLVLVRARFASHEATLLLIWGLSHHPEGWAK